MNTKLIFFPIFLITTIFPSSVNAIPEYKVSFQDIDCFENVCCRQAQWSTFVGEEGKQERFYLVQSANNATVYVLHDNDDTQAKYEINGVASEHSLQYKSSSDERVKVKVTPISEAGTIRFCIR